MRARSRDATPLPDVRWIREGARSASAWDLFNFAVADGNLSHLFWIGLGVQAVSEYTDRKATERAKSYRRQVFDTVWIAGVFVIGIWLGAAMRGHCP